MPCLPEEGGGASLVPTGLSPRCAGGVAMLSDECVCSLLPILATDLWAMMGSCSERLKQV